jgi:hypothetical protein
MSMHVLPEAILIAAVRAPHDDPSQTAMFSLERRQIADAALVQATAVVDDQNVTSARALHCFQENVSTLPKCLAGSTGPARR